MERICPPPINVNVPDSVFNACVTLPCVTPLSPPPKTHRASILPPRRLTPRHFQPNTQSEMHKEIQTGGAIAEQTPYIKS
ncbi:hypothetical protein GDO81_014657 [Engystomops pustulosus]|uniref:Uncharacterized protein n=1 Tax=Engystomops pustulosus TaxID=76066 RepID=A0AAV7BBU3_ENGPU|nr:hypothetical protein GDO81_014657 [Engystomops pustulosus]